MKLSYSLRAVCGVTHTQGNLLFDTVITPHASSSASESTVPVRETVLYSAIGHRVNAYDLSEGHLSTLPFTMRQSIDVMAISPNKRFMVLVERDSDYAMLVNLPKNTVLKYFLKIKWPLYLLIRCHYCKQRPPIPAWQGVWFMNWKY